MPKKRPTTLGDIEFDVLVNETADYKAEIPQYPVEDGYSVSDNISLSPLTINITVIASNLPVTYKDYFGSNKHRMEAVRGKLIELYKSRKPVTYRSTISGMYRNMVISSMSIPRKDMSKAVEIAIGLTQIRITKAKVVDVVSSCSRSGATGTSAGTASTTAETEEDTKKKGSILYNAVNGLSDMISNLIGE